jgi:hypothetical protein
VLKVAALRQSDIFTLADARTSLKMQRNCIGVLRSPPTLRLQWPIRAGRLSATGDEDGMFQAIAKRMHVAQ